MGKMVDLFSTCVKVLMLILMQPTCGDAVCNTQPDPCYRFNGAKEVPNIYTRHPNISYNPATASDKYCDLYAMNSSVWYISDYPMTTSQVNIQSCGADLPIWMNDSMPSAADGFMNRTVCVRSLHSACDPSYSVNVKDCGFFYVYCLWEVPKGCHQRFCFDVDLNKQTATVATTTTESAATAVPPVIDVASTPAPKHAKGDNQWDTGWLEVLAFFSITGWVASVAHIVWSLKRKCSATVDSKRSSTNDVKEMPKSTNIFYNVGSES